MTTLDQLAAKEWRTTRGDELALCRDALRYRALRQITPRQFTALHKSVLLHHDKDESFEEAFDRIVDVLILTLEADERGRG